MIFFFCEKIFAIIRHGKINKGCIDPQLKCCIGSRKCANTALIIIVSPLIMVSCIIKPNSHISESCLIKQKCHFDCICHLTFLCSHH